MIPGRETQTTLRYVRSTSAMIAGFRDKFVSVPSALDTTQWKIPVTTKIHTTYDSMIRQDVDERFFGAKGRDRTGDISLTKGVLYQLSYFGVLNCGAKSRD